MLQGKRVVTPAAFVEQLAAVSLPVVFNPYRDVCPEHDRSDAPAIRRRNLALMLAATTASETVWFGRDLGWRGGRRTGLPLTDEARLPFASHLASVAGFVVATRSGPQREATAGHVWAMIECLHRDQGVSPPLLWNAFPFHPHPPGRPLANRPHTAAEARIGREIAAALLDWLRPRRLVALGCSARQALVKLGHDNDCVRHPSFGGQRRFMAQIGALYRAQSSEQRLDSSVA